MPNNKQVYGRVVLVVTLLVITNRMNGGHTRHIKSIFVGQHAHDRSVLEHSEISYVQELARTTNHRQQQHVRQFNHITVGYDRNDLSFQELHSPVVPFFIRKGKPCSCHDSLSSCKHLVELTDPRAVEKMKGCYHNLKERALQQSATLPEVSSELNLHNTLVPHFENLLRVMQTNSHSQWAVAAILNHAKTEELSFWVYCQMLSHFPTQQSFSTELKNLLMARSVSLYDRIADLQASEQFDLKRFSEELYSTRLASLLRCNCYSKFIGLLLTATTPDYPSKVVFCYLLYLKRPLLKASDEEFGRLLYTYMKSADIDWEAILNAAATLAQSRE